MSYSTTTPTSVTVTTSWEDENGDRWAKYVHFKGVVGALTDDVDLMGNVVQWLTDQADTLDEEIQSYLGTPIDDMSNLPKVTVVKRKLNK